MTPDICTIAIIWGFSAIVFALTVMSAKRARLVMEDEADHEADREADVDEHDSDPFDGCECYGTTERTSTCRDSQ